MSSSSRIGHECEISGLLSHVSVQFTGFLSKAVDKNLQLFDRI